jgi:hypothetical protein
MSAKIFLSCGQANERERSAAACLKRRLTEQGFDVYVAIQAQSIQDVNSGIIAELQRSDYYLFVDFRREVVRPDDVHGRMSRLRHAWRALANRGAPEARGSLFTHQELAIAYVSEFEHVLFFQERGVKLEGLMRYLAANATRFDTVDKLVEDVSAAVRRHGWRTDYSRHLIATRHRWSDGCIHCGDPDRGDLTGRFLYVDIENKRGDLAAFDTVARLESIEPFGGKKYLCKDRSLLKVAGQPGFNQIIWPCSHGAFDFLAVDEQQPWLMYLNSALDKPRVPLIKDRGRYTLGYAVLASDFPVLRFTIDLELTGKLETTTATLGETTITADPVLSANQPPA